MEIVNGAIADVEDDVDNLEGQVTVLFGDQVIQDEQLLELGTATESVYIHAFNNTSRFGHSFFAVCWLQEKDDDATFDIHILTHKMTSLIHKSAD